MPAGIVVRSRSVLYLPRGLLIQRIRLRGGRGAPRRVVLGAMLYSGQRALGSTWVSPSMFIQCPEQGAFRE